MNFTEIILRRLKECPLLAKNGVTAVGFAGMDAKKRSMSILNTNGELTVREYIDGGRDMQYPFALLYHSLDTDTAGKLEAQQLIDDVAEWLTADENLPAADGCDPCDGCDPSVGCDPCGGCCIQNIKRADTCTLISEDEDGAVFQGSFNLEYYMEG